MKNVLLSDFNKYWLGQTVSNLGSSFTSFALPLLVYQMTSSPLDLAFVTVFQYAPMVMFGLLIGVWIDRLSRRRLMIFADISRFITISLIPLLWVIGSLTIAWIYVIAFINGVMWITSNATQPAATKSLAGKGNLLRANGRLQSSYQLARILGPGLAGVAVSGGVPVPTIFILDALSYVTSFTTLLAIRTEFSNGTVTKRQRMHEEIGDGLRFTFRDPLLRNISILAFLVNIFGITIWTQLVAFAKLQMNVSGWHVGVLYAAGSLGIALLSVSAAKVRMAASFSSVLLCSIMLYGVLIIGMAFSHSFLVVVPIWTLAAGLPYSYSLHTLSLRQAIVPDHLLGRTFTVAQVVAWASNPVGSLLGGWAVTESKNIAFVFGILGGLIFVSGCAFWPTTLGKADRYVSERYSSVAADGASP